jgi:hypothetical protein
MESVEAFKTAKTTKEKNKARRKELIRKLGFARSSGDNPGFSSGRSDVPTDQDTRVSRRAGSRNFLPTTDEEGSSDGSLAG